MGEAKAGKLVAVNAVFHSISELSTVLDQAAHSSNRFWNRIIPTAEAGIPLPSIGPAKAAIDPARGDQLWAGGKCRGSCHKNAGPPSFNLIR